MKCGKSKRQWKDENAKRFHDMDRWIKNCKPIKTEKQKAIEEQKNKNKKEDKKEK